MSEPEPPRFDAALKAERRDLVQTIGDAIKERVARYRDVPEDAWSASVDRLIGVFLDALGEHDPSAVRGWTWDRLRGSEPGDFPLEAILCAVSIIRDCLTERAREAVEAREPGAWEATRVFAAVHDDITGALIDFSHRRVASAHRAQTETEEHYRALYLRTPVMMQAMDASGAIVGVNNRWVEVMGYAREEVIGKRTIDLFTEESRRYAREVGIASLVREGTCRDVPYELIKKSGEVVSVLLSAVAELDMAGRPYRYLAVLVDVTERQRFERELRESEERYRLLVELSPLAIAVHQAGVVVYANPASARLIGAKSPEDLIGTKILDYVHPDDREKVLDRVRRMTQEREHVELTQERFVRVDGATIEVEAAASPVTHNGAPAVQVVFVDVSERRKTEEALRRSAVQEEVIRTQEAMLRALSTPLIPVGDRVVVMPLIGQIDDARAARILEALLAGVAAHRAKAAILDVTGVPELSAEAASSLLRAARAVRLLGAEVVLTGIAPAIARTLVVMGLDVGDIATRATLKDGIDHATRGGALS